MEKKDERIVITGAHSHNLKNISLSIPRGKFVVITGLSGSGKSTLAFDTLYAEGQRRYMDTLSAYAKHFMGAMEKPEVESITGLSPIIAIEQKTTGSNPRSTVGTITEIYDFLRLLYARAATCYSPATGKAMVRYTDQQIVDLLLENYGGKRCWLLSPLVVGRKGHYKELFDTMRRRGYTEVRIDGEIHDLSGVTALDRYKTHFIELVVDKLVPDKEDMKRLHDSVMTALNYGKGSLAILENGKLQHFSKHLVDPDTGLSIPEPAPHSFSFNSPQGCCPHCKGLGTIVNVDMDSIIPDRNISIADGGIGNMETAVGTGNDEAGKVVGIGNGGGAFGLCQINLDAVAVHLVALVSGSAALYLAAVGVAQGNGCKTTGHGLLVLGMDVVGFTEVDVRHHTCVR